MFHKKVLVKPQTKNTYLDMNMNMSPSLALSFLAINPRKETEKNIHIIHRQRLISYTGGANSSNY